MIDSTESVNLPYDGELDDFSRAMAVYGPLLEMNTPRDQSTILYSNRGGSGKTFTGVDMMAVKVLRLGFHELTNIKFIQAHKNPDTGKVEIDPRLRTPHPRVHYVTNLIQWWMEYAKIIIEDPTAYISFDFDELNKLNPKDRHYTPLAYAFRCIWTENRKFRLIPNIYGQQIRKIPTDFIPTINYYVSKSKRITAEYNRKKGTHYGPKELAFVIDTEGLDLQKWKEDDFHIEDVCYIFKIGRGPWTGDIHHPVDGQFYYDPRGSAAFKLGVLNGKENWHEDLLDYLSESSSFGIGQAIMEFFEDRADKKTLEWLSKDFRASQARALYSYHKANGMLGEDGEPFVEIGIGRRKTKIPIEHRLLSALFDYPESTARFHIEKVKKDAKKGNTNQTPPET